MTYELLIRDIEIKYEMQASCCLSDKCSEENNRTIGRPKVNQSINSLMNEWIN